jgi:hypothetical protein
VSADGIWLGPDLLARIDRNALQPVANAEKVGTTLRLLLREDSTLDALEAVLSPILPSSDDWKQGTQRRAKPHARESPRVP